MDGSTEQLSRDRRHTMRDDLLEWFEEEGRSFPWRGHSDPYAILVLEVMSQQTQLGRIAEAWEAFIDRWPTTDALAAASTGDVIAFWSTHRLGYNRRAEYLHRSARHIEEAWDGDVPPDPERLQELPGVGPYTSRAVASFAFGEAHAVVDTNVERVLGRAFDVGDDALETLADELLPSAAAASWNEAVMDLGATVCTPEPSCDSAPCPWRDRCVAYATDDFDRSGGATGTAFEGSRRQYRGRIVRSLAADGPMGIDALGSAIHEEYGEEGFDRDWLRSLLDDLAAEGLVTVDGTTVALP